MSNLLKTSTRNADRDMIELESETTPKVWAEQYVRAHGRDNSIKLIQSTIQLLEQNSYANPRTLKFYKAALVTAKGLK